MPTEEQAKEIFDEQYKQHINLVIFHVKRFSENKEFLPTSDLIARIQKSETYKDGDKDQRSFLWWLVSEWNDFLRNTPLSMDLFIGEGAIFEGFEKQETGIGVALAYRLHGKDERSRILLCPPFRRDNWRVRVFDGKVQYREQFINQNLNALANYLSAIEQKEYLFLK